ncbi:MAG: FAD-dependent oxidoreductase [Candidatus Babeliales bacterium]|nr:FAD-dependent oxidoreductase [Candidatus Babeliales bacterium]
MMKRMSKKALLGLAGACVIAMFLLALLQHRSSIFGHKPTISIDNALEKGNIVPLLILGSGPSGLAAAIYAVAANIRTVVAYGPLPGGLLTQTSLVENWPGEQSIMGPQIIKNMQDHATSLAEKYLKNAHDEIDKIEFLQDTIVSIDNSVWPFEVKTERGHTLNALAIIVATGASPKLLNVAGEQEYWKKGVTSCATCDAPFYRDKDVVVSGGGDSAAEQAIQLARHAKNITILVRKDAMRASAIMQKRLTEYPSIKILYNVSIKEIVGDGTKVNGVKLLNHSTNKETVMPCDGVFLAIGHTPNSQVVRGIVDTDDHGYIKVKGRSQHTSVEGIFASGDVEDTRYRQAGSSSGYGIGAALDAVNFLTSAGYNTTVAAQMERSMFKVGKAQIKEVFVIKSVADFDQQVTHHKGFVVVDCFMEDCYFCKVMDPIFKEVAGEYEGEVSFVQLDIDAVPSMAKKLVVSSAPTFFVYNDGKLVGRYNGAMKKLEFSAFIESFLHQSEEALQESHK